MGDSLAGDQERVGERRKELVCMCAVLRCAELCTPVVIEDVGSEKWSYDESEYIRNERKKERRK